MASPRAFIRCFIKICGSLNDDVRGYVLIFGALLVPVLVGAAGLVIDVGFSLQQRSKAQAAADFAAIAGAEILGTSGRVLSDAQNAAYAIAIQNGFQLNEVTADYPWGSSFSNKVGNYASSNTTANPYVFEVRISTIRNNIFGSFFNMQNTTIGVRAVANYQPALPCIVLMDTTSTPASNSGLSVSGGASLLTPCGLYINSTDDNHALFVNSGTLCAPNGLMSLVSVNNGESSNTSGACSRVTVQTEVGKTVANPYASTIANPLSASAPSTTASTFQYKYLDDNILRTGNITSNGPNTGIFDTITCGSHGNGCSIQYNISAAQYYSGGINISGSPSANNTVQLPSGETYVGSYGLNVSRATVNSDPAGSTLALTSPNTGTINAGAGSAINLTAPSVSSTTAAYPGFAVVQNDPTINVASVSGNTGISPSGAGGGGTMNVSGLVVMPYSNFTLTSGGSNSNLCTGYIVWTLTLTGGASATDTSSCQVSNVNTTGQRSAILVE